MPGNGNGGNGDTAITTTVTGEGGFSYGGPTTTGLTAGEGGTTVGGPAPEPEPVPEPAPEPGEPEYQWAANRQVANIDRTSRYAAEQYRSALEQVHTAAQAAGPAAPPMAQDYEFPDIAFGERIY